MQDSRQKEIKAMLNFAETIEETTDWEQDFLISIENQFKRRGELSDKQFDTLEKIVAKHGY